MLVSKEVENVRFWLFGLTLKTVFDYFSQWNELGIWFSLDFVHRVSYLHIFGHFRIVISPEIEPENGEP